MPEKNASDVAYCSALAKRHGKSYYFASKFFPRSVRNATYFLYAFFRVPDELVDNPRPNTKPKEELENWINKWREAYKTDHSDSPVLRAAVKVFKKFEIPYQYSEDFLSAMLMDLHKKRYANYNELERYMYGSAAVVGLMMTYLIGFNDERALFFAEKLGYAMQLTNFIRDFSEDYHLRGRIYLPQDEMDRFGVSEEDLQGKRFNDNVCELMRFQVDRARNLYEEARKGIVFLKPKGRLAVRVALRLYGAILDKIEAQEYDIFRKRAHTGFLEKIFLFLGELLWRRR
jgi:phytoene synthase